MRSLNCSNSTKNSRLVRDVTLLLLASFLGCSPLLKKPNDRSAAALPQITDPTCPLRFAKENLCAQVEPLETPIEAGTPTSFQVSFWDPELGSSLGPFADPLDLGWRPSVDLWMDMPGGDSHGGMGKVRTVPQEDPDGKIITGVYRAWRAIFTMNGIWQVRVQLRDPDGKKFDEVIHFIDIK